MGGGDWESSLLVMNALFYIYIFDLMLALPSVLCMMDEKLSEVQQRYEVAWHYLIPYPRLHHVKQRGRRDIPVNPNHV